jgi:hypothetical protein
MIEDQTKYTRNTTTRIVWLLTMYTSMPAPSAKSVLH